jgi:hypothetical protein
MIVVDEYLAIRSLVGDLPSDLPDDFLGVPVSAHLASAPTAPQSR